MLLLFYAPWLVDKLKLLKGFDDERIEFGRMNSTDLYRMGVFFIGGVFLLKHLSALLVNAGHFFKNDQAGQLISEQMKMNLIINIIAIFIAFLLITNGKRIAGWISDRNN